MPITIHIHMRTMALRLQELEASLLKEEAGLLLKRRLLEFVRPIIENVSCDHYEVELQTTSIEGYNPFCSLDFKVQNRSLRHRIISLEAIMLSTGDIKWSISIQNVKGDIYSEKGYGVNHQKCLADFRVLHSFLCEHDGDARCLI